MNTSQDLFLVSQHTYIKKDGTQGIKTMFLTDGGQIITSYSIPLSPTLIPVLPIVSVTIKPWVNEKGQMVQLITAISPKA